MSVIPITTHSVFLSVCVCVCMCVQNESPSISSKKSRSQTLTTEVVSEVKYHIGATYSPKNRSSNHLPSSDDDISTDSSTSSLESKEDTPTTHANGGDNHVHHFSSPPDIVGSGNNLPPPTLFGHTHSAVCERPGTKDRSSLVEDDTPEITPPPGFGEGKRATTTTPNSATNHKLMSGRYGANGEGASPQDEGETLFNEIMYSMPPNVNMDKRLSCMDKKTSSTNLDWGDSGSRTNSESRDDHTVRTTPPDEHGIDHDRMDSSNTLSDRVSRSSSMDEGSTPKASPYTSPSSIRRWSVKKRRSYDHNDPDEVPTTTKTSPYIRRHHSASARSVSASSTGSDVFPLPILDPPTPFRNPVKVERLGPFPDENLEACEDDHSDDPHSKRNSAMSVGETSRTDYSTETLLTNSTSNDRPSHITPPPDMLFHTSDIAALAVSESTGKSPKKSKKSSPVKRSHSFGSNKRITILHRREGSLSTNNSPLPTQKFPADKVKESSGLSFVAKVMQRRHSRGSPAPVTPGSREESIPGTPTEIPSIHIDASSKEDLAETGSTHSLILPPPAEFKSASDSANPSRASSESREEEEVEIEKEEKSRFSFFRIKHHHNSNKHSSRSATPSDLIREDKRVDVTASMPGHPLIVTPVGPPRDSDMDNSPMRSSNDMMSFDEALESYDQYATHTGKTAHSAKQAKNVRDALNAAPASLFPPSPSPTEEVTKKEGKKKEKKKKKKRHGYTVANIDSDTMKAVQMNLATKEEARKSSVHQLAREYSQRIKERTKVHKKHSTVFEDDEADAIFQDPFRKPEWLAQLGMKKRQSSTGNIVDMNAVEDDDHSSTGSGADAIEPTSLQQSMRTDRESAAYHGALNHRGGRASSQQQQQRHTLSHMHQHRAWVEEEAKTGKLKGWVRSLAGKFARKEGTTL